MAYTDKDIHKCLLVYRDTGRNMSATTRQTKVSKPTLYKWAGAGEPVAITGGKSWDEYLDELERAQVQEIKAREIVQEREFIDQAKTQARQMLDRIYDKVMFSDVEIKAADYDKLMRLYIMLDGKEQDKVDFMEAFVAKCLEIVMDIVDDAQLMRIKNRFISLQKSEKEKLGLLPNAK